MNNPLLLPSSRLFEDSNLIDGAHFGPAFPHVFLIEYPKFNASDKFAPYQPKIFGYNVFERKDKGLFYAHATNKIDLSNSSSDSGVNENEKKLSVPVEEI